MWIIYHHVYSFKGENINVIIVSSLLNTYLCFVQYLADVKKMELLRVVMWNVW